ncbi:transmembrane protease serine 11G-like [Hyposmocoma kahamanoa]|uniref:transmembrane protease serine 11G-like n=1 Tax=Hyposmocoma kahamanoa TaxID=1477025 RepID=UPI000E6DA43C|nr:transmembrane protease serine 11G-like [Hyposmocoma kahamanoa]
MYFLLVLGIFIYKVDPSHGNVTNISMRGDNLSVNDITDTLLAVLGIHEDGNLTNSGRIKELKDKLQAIDSYVVDKEKYRELLMNETRHSTLNQTNFYSALNEQDYFQTLTNETMSLYLKLKVKMNRDDIVKLLSEKTDNTNMNKSARRSLMDNVEAGRRRLTKFEEMVDKYIGEVAVDEHTFDENDRYVKTWDPQAELEERKTFHQHDGRRIFRGERTTVRYYPFMVSVHVMGRFWCGGSIFWSDIVLTSASCLQLMHNNRFFRENPKTLFVRVGSNHSRVGGETIEALEVYFHPAYNSKRLRNNIAIIRLRRHVKFSYHHVPKRIDISHNDMGISFTAEVLLLGWGVSKATQKLTYEPIFLQRKLLPIYPSKFCKEIYGEQFITESMFCAGTVTTGEGACDHDAGGPAIMNGLLVGIISFGPTVCGFPDAPTVFTLVGAYADWIETVNETMPPYYSAYKRTTTTALPPYVEYFRTLPKRKITLATDSHTTSIIDLLTKTTESTTTAELRLRHGDAGTQPDGEEGMFIDFNT